MDEFDFNGAPQRVCKSLSQSEGNIFLENAVSLTAGVNAEVVENNLHPTLKFNLRQEESDDSSR